MAEQTQTTAPAADPFTKCKEIVSKSSDFYDIDVRFSSEHIEKTALIYVQKNFWGRAGKQHVFLAAHVALESQNSEKPPQKFVECLRKATEYYEKYLPNVVEKYKPAYGQLIDNLKFLISNPDAAFKAELDILRKTGKIKTVGLQLAK